VADELVRRHRSSVDDPEAVALVESSIASSFCSKTSRLTCRHPRSRACSLAISSMRFPRPLLRCSGKTAMALMQ
jgi:hypothetical protein